VVPLGGAALAAPSQTYRVQLDAQPPAGEPWAFNELFPHRLKVHQGDVVDAAWGGAESPHTATFVPVDDAGAWRAANQAPGGAWAVAVADQVAGGDDGDVILNPAIAAPSQPGCGDAAHPCAVTGTGVVNSGLQFSNPAAQPSFSIKVNAPPGEYSLLCLLHVGMQIPLRVAPSRVRIPSPQKVATTASHQIKDAVTDAGPAADAVAQQVQTSSIGGGHTRWTINAGGFVHQVTANEFVDSGLSVHVGDQVQVNESFDPGTLASELHTASFPLSAAASHPFLVPQCEVPGPDTPPPCASPAQLELVLNPTVLAPTASNALVDPNAYVNSGLFGSPQSTFTFVAQAPGTYTMVCLVHGPEMSTTFTVT